MGKTVSVRFNGGKVVPSRSTRPSVRAEAEALGEAFLAAPGPVVVGVNPALPDGAKEAARWLLAKSKVPGFAERFPQEKILDARSEEAKCPSCKGDGRVAWDEPCTDCLGSGKAEGGPYISDETFVREYTARFPPEMPCSQCGQGMNPAEAMLGPVCGKCCRKNQRAATRR